LTHLAVLGLMHGFHLGFGTRHRVTGADPRDVRRPAGPPSLSAGCLTRNPRATHHRMGPQLPLAVSCRSPGTPIAMAELAPVSPRSPPARSAKRRWCSGAARDGGEPRVVRLILGLTLGADRIPGVGLGDHGNGFQRRWSLRRPATDRGARSAWRCRNAPEGPAPMRGSGAPADPPWGCAQPRSAPVRASGSFFDKAIGEPEIGHDPGSPGAIFSAAR